MLIPNSVCAIGALRVHYAHRVYYYTKLNPSATYDITWEALGSWVSTAVEANIAVWCACAPALKTYLNGWLNKSDQDQRTFRWYGRISQGWWRPRSSGQLPDSGCQMGIVDIPDSSGSTIVVLENRQLTHISSHTMSGPDTSTKPGAATELIERMESGGSDLSQTSPYHRKPLERNSVG